MVLPEVKEIARWIDRMIVLLGVGSLAWVTWQLGGVLPCTMGVGLLGLFGAAGWVVLRWWVIDATGAPPGWWYPLPLLAWVSCHMLGLAELPSRGWLHGWHMWSGLPAFWIGLHVARDARLWRWTLVGVGVITLVVFGAAVFQRVGDATWLPLGRGQVAQYLGRSAGTFGNPNTMAAWLVVVLPAAVGFAWKPSLERSAGSRWFAAGVALAALVGVGLSYSRGVLLALVIGASLAWLIDGRKTWSRRLGLFGVMGLVLAGLIWSAYHANEQVQQRVDTLVEFRGERTRPLLWGIAIDLWQERPLVGYGGGSFGGLMERHRPEGLWESADSAHNEYLNGLSEYGLVGAFLAFGVIALFFRNIRRIRERPPGVLLGLGILAMAVSIDFHWRIPAVWWLAALALGAVLAVRQNKPTKRFTNSKQLGSICFGVGVSLCCWILPWLQAGPIFRAEELRWTARESLDRLEGVSDAQRIRGEATAAVVTLREAAALDAGSERIWQDISYGVSLQGFREFPASLKLGLEAEEAARRALVGSELVAEHWVRLGVALDQQGRWAEAGPAFGRAVTLAPRQPVMWYYQGFHLSLKPATRELAKAALSTCLRLDPWYDEAKLLIAELERTP